jgi:flagellar basal-body rod protein FlgG
MRAGERRQRGAIMIRALYSAATGMQSQQLNIDVIANNLANVNTVGFKKARADFQDLLYQTIRDPGSASTATTQSPTGIQVGLGTRPAAVQRMFMQGSVNLTGNPLDVAIEGDGFFQVALQNGDVVYTRAGSFKVDNQSRLVTSEGDPVQPAINLPINAESISIGQDGIVTAKIPGQAALSQVGQIQLVRFANPAGLLALGRNLSAETESSGTPQTGTPGQDGLGTVLQGFLEQSNVTVVEELIALISGQRAYEVTSKAITAADEMLRTTNSIVR